MLRCLKWVGVTFEKQEEFGSLESVKAVSDRYIPVGGEIVSINEQLEGTPGLVNEDPYGKRWIAPVGVDTLLPRTCFSYG